MRKFWERVEELWCMTMHSGTMWPMNGRYVCRECLREYPVPFEAKLVAKPRRETAFVPSGVAVRRA
jgi:hypothetical protein